MKNNKYKIDLNEEEKEELIKLLRKQSISQNIAKRARLILLVAEEERLKDRPRSGRKARITAEQWCKIMALACEKPENHGIPITHWSHSTLTAEIIKQGIVETISMSHVGEFLQALKRSAINH